MSYCGATTRRGTECERPAGWGTDHVGFGHCKLHGGASPNGKKHAERQAAEAAVATYGLPREIDPHTALTEELWRTAGHVEYLGRMIAAFGSDDKLKQYGSTIVETDEDGNTQRTVVWERPAIWVQLYQAERKHLAEIAKTCVTVGIEQKRVEMMEALGVEIANFGRRLVARLGHDPADPVVREAFRAELTVIQGGHAG